MNAKKIALAVIETLFVGMLAFGLVAPAVMAQGNIPDPFIEDAEGPVTIGGWVDVLVTVVQWFYTIVFIIAVLFILLAAYNFITSKGDPGKTKTARSQLMYAVVGIAVALLSYTIIYFVRSAIETRLG